MPDLFGNEDRLETSPSKGVSVSLFEHTAERISYEGGRNVEQVRIELVHGTIDSHVQSCERCGGRFLAKPRVPAVCNLCERGTRRTIQVG